MLFYFNIRSEHMSDIDKDGIDFPSLEAAIAEARRAAKEMVAEMMMQDEQIDDMSFEITGHAGIVLATVRFRDMVRFEVGTGLKPG